MNIFRASTLICLVLVAAVRSRAGSVLAGTELEVRLTTGVSSNQASGSEVHAVVIAPVFVNGQLVIPAGTEVDGKTADSVAAKQATDTVAASPANVRILFTAIRPAHSGRGVPLHCIVETVDNARESVDSSGLIVGITASDTIESRMDQGIAKLATRNAQFGQFLSSVEGAFVKKVDPSIDFKPGVELLLKLTEPLAWSEPAAVAVPPAIVPANQLLHLLSVEPIRTVAEKPPKPSDLTNLLFIGSLEQVESAFKKAGWFPSAQKGSNANMETARAIIEDRGYSEAPMSVLFLDGRPPDLTFEKQNDTFSKRHHIRIWQRPETFNGQPVFVAAATHDTSITFSPVSRSFTHGIDPNIDKERAKVVNDLLFTGTVHGLALVARTSLPPDPSNATGDHLETDGKIAILQF